jgi:hypothetical protein
MQGILTEGKGSVCGCPRCTTSSDKLRFILKLNIYYLQNNLSLHGDQLY